MSTDKFDYRKKLDFRDDYVDLDINQLIQCYIQVTKFVDKWQHSNGWQISSYRNRQLYLSLKLDELIPQFSWIILEVRSNWTYHEVLKSGEYGLIDNNILITYDQQNKEFQTLKVDGELKIWGKTQKIELVEYLRSF